MNRFTEQTVVVTGAAGGIGAAIARAAAADGANVVWVDRSKAVTGVAQGGLAVVADICDPDFPEALRARLAQQGWRVDHLVGAAGIQVRTRALDVSESDWQRLLDINLTGFYRLVRGLAADLVERGGGSILAVGSMSADRATPGIVPYGATKAALTQLIRGLAVELGPSGVRCNALAPGYVATPMTRDLLERPDQWSRVMSRIPLGRIAQPEDMAGAALFLLSSDAAYITGQVLGVDGGYAAT